MAITKYTDQVWKAPIAGETLSVNGYYVGEHLGKPMQATGETEANADAHYVEHNTVRFGTITQDAASNADMPTVAEPLE